MATGHNIERQTVIDQRTTIALLIGKNGKRSRNVEHAERCCGGTNAIRMANRFRSEFLENRQFYRQSPVGSISDFTFKCCQFRRGEAHGICHRLTVDEASLGSICVGHAPCIIGCHFDKITKHIVMLDLQRFDGCFLDIIGLKTRDHPARLITERAHFVEFCIVVLTHETAVAFQKRHFISQGPVEMGCKTCRYFHNRVAGIAKFVWQKRAF